MSTRFTGLKFAVLIDLPDKDKETFSGNGKSVEGYETYPRNAEPARVRGILNIDTNTLYIYLIM